MISLTVEQLTALSELGLTTEQIVRAAEIFCPRTSSDTLDARREKDRIRKAESRAAAKRTSADVSSDTKTGGGVDSLSLSEKDSGKEDSGLVVAREPDPVDQLKDLWNETAEELGLPKVQHLTEARRKAARKRLAECGGMAGMRHAMDRIRASPGLQGKAGGRNWRANFDWLMQPSSFTKLMEGGYDHWQAPKSDLMAAADRLRERVGAQHRQDAQGGGGAPGFFDGADAPADLYDDRISY